MAPLNVSLSQIDLRQRHFGMMNHAEIGLVPAGEDFRLQHFLRRTARHQAPLMQQQDTIGVQRRQIEIVQHTADAQRLLARQRAQQAQGMLLVVKIQRRRRLVEEQPGGDGCGCHSCANTRASCTRCCSPPDS